MRKFFKWLFKIFRPDPKGYVRNIQDSDTPKVAASGSSVRGMKKAVSDRDSFFWLPVSRVSGVTKNDKGLTASIKPVAGFDFVAVAYQGEPGITIRKQGLSKVNFHLEFKLDGDDKLAEAAGELISDKKNITILHINRYGDGFLYGESMGLELKGFENGRLVLEGVEDNVFYEISRECVQATVPAKE